MSARCSKLLEDRRADIERRAARLVGLLRSWLDIVARRPAGRFAALAGSWSAPETLKDGFRAREQEDRSVDHSHLPLACSWLPTAASAA
jgi:hypothetical protein